MNERPIFEHYHDEKLEKIAPPADSFEVLENSFAVASPCEHAYMHTEDLFDCKAVFLRNTRTGKTLLAHLSCVADLDTTISRWVDLVATPDQKEGVDAALFTGSTYDPNNDANVATFENPTLQYPSLKTLQSSVLNALDEKVGTFTVNTDASDIPRAVAINLTTGEYYEVDPMAGNDERADTSRNQIIQPM